MDDPPRSVRPSARTASLYARTVFRELRRAGASKAEILSFVNEMMTLVTTAQDDGPLTAITDPETQAPNTEAVVDALDFEIRFARERSSTLLVVVVDAVVAEWVPNDVAQSLHADVARCLRRGARTHDLAGRIDANRHVVVLAGARLENAERIVWRWLEPLIAPRRADDERPSGISLRYAATAYEGSTSTMHVATSKEPIVVESGQGLLARTLAIPPLELTGPPRASSALRAAKPASARGREVILALGGGAARAAAHIGVLRALREDGLELVGVAGTSAGALVGAMSLCGMSDGDIQERFVTFPQTTTYRHMRRLYAKYRQRSQMPRSAVEYFRRSGLAFVSSAELAAIDDATFEAFIEHFVGPDRDISTLSRPFSATATDLIGGRTIALSSGPLHAALRATCAVPGLFAPQRIEERLMIDGSTTSDIPIRAALGLGARGRVIGVHLARPEQRVEHYTASVEVVTRASALVHTELVREQLRHAPELVLAPVQEIGWLDFRRALELVQVGLEAMQAHLDAP